MDEDLINTQPIPVIGIELPTPTTRSDVVRKLTRGLGVGHSVEHGDRIQYEILLNAELRLLLGEEEGDQRSAHHYLAAALKLMPITYVRFATENALGFRYREAKNLTERRRLGAAHLGVSERTIVRYELEGANRLPHYLDLSDRLDTLKENPGIDANLDLQQRVLLLEHVVAALLEVGPTGVRSDVKRAYD